MLCLTTASHPAWARCAVAHPETLLPDHAHCESKAASNALSLAPRVPLEAARVLATIAAEELDHYQRVLTELSVRGLELGTPNEDRYASELRRLAHVSALDRPFRNSVADRLLVAALIEARSCERFALLEREFAAVGEARLSAFYASLFASEARHYAVLVDLAVRCDGNEQRTRCRLRELAELEGQLVALLPNEPTIHG